MAQTMANNMAGGMTGTNIAAANTSVGNYFMVTDILHTQPMNPLVSGSSGTATQDMKNYGMAIAAMSQSAKDMGMTSSSSMVTSMMSDASDGVMNGLMGSTPIMMGGMMTGSSMMTTTAGTSGLASEMATFITSTMNKSGVTATDMQTLMNHLASSATGTIQSGGGTMMNGMVSGSVFNGSMSDSTVMAYSMTGGAMGAQLASGTTNSMGSFSLSLGAYSGPVMLKMSGGSYDEPGNRHDHDHVVRRYHDRSHSEHFKRKHGHRHSDDTPYINGPGHGQQHGRRHDRREHRCGKHVRGQLLHGH